jgi:hypothetical protein
MRLAITLALIFLPSMAYGGDFDPPGWAHCRDGSQIVYNIDAGDTGDTPQMHIQDPSGTIWFDPDTSSQGSATKVLDILHCPNGKPASSPTNECESVFNSSADHLDGTPGNASTQKMGITVVGGYYYANLSTAGGNAARIVVQCHDSVQ